MEKSPAWAWKFLFSKKKIARAQLRAKRDKFAHPWFILSKPVGGMNDQPGNLARAQWRIHSIYSSLERSSVVTRARAHKFQKPKETKNQEEKVISAEFNMATPSRDPSRESLKKDEEDSVPSEERSLTDLKFKIKPFERKVK